MPFPAERFASLDHIRGLSILGILIVNAIAFAQPFDVYVNPNLSPVPMTAADSLAWWAIETFARDKFITLFSLLFGISVFLVGQTGNDVLRRRLVWLLVFGLVHGVLVWHGDILLLYAATGLVFMRWRDRPARWLIVTGAGLYLITALALIGLYSLSRLMPTGFELPPRPEGFIGQMRSGFWSSLGGNAWQWSQDIIAALMVFGPHTLGLMMLGLGLFKGGFFKGESPPGVYLAALFVGAAGLAATALLQAEFAANGFAITGPALIYDAVTLLVPLAISLAYAAALMLLARRGAGWLLYPLACAGRMAFTNYLSQSLIMTALFYGGRWPQGVEVFGLQPPLYGTLNHAGLVPMVAAIWAGQLLFSMAWLQAFRYGPFEWVWRCLTHRRWVGLLRS